MDMEQPSQLAAEVAQPWTRPVVLVPVFALIAAVGGLFPSFSVRANLLVLGSGGAMMWLGLSNRLRRPRPPHRLGPGAAWWLLPALGLAAVELVNFALGSTYAHPTLSKLADPLLEGYLARSGLYFAWLAAFWGLARR